MKAKHTRGLPKRINIAGHSVKVVPTAWDDGRYGQYFQRNNTLEVNTTVCKNQQRTTVLHEILHGCFRAAGLASMPGMTQQKHERIVCGLEVTLFQVLRENPQLVKFICDEKDGEA